MHRRKPIPIDVKGAPMNRFAFSVVNLCFAGRALSKSGKEEWLYSFNQKMEQT